MNQHRNKSQQNQRMKLSIHTLLVNLLIAVSSGSLVIASSQTNDVSVTNLPMNLNTIDESLNALEAAHDDIVKNTEKSIRWYDGKKQTALSIIYLHGYSASRKELSPVTERLADIIGANVFYTRLRGHGRTDDAMAEATEEDWLKDTEAAYKIGALIGEKVVVISTSTGGTLATWLNAQSHTTQIIANIMISPNFGIKSRSGEIVRWPWGLKLAKLISGPYRSFEPNNEVHDAYWTQRYPIEALVPMITLVDKVRELDKSKINVPQFIVYSPDDQVISVERIIDTSKEFTGATVTLIPFNQSKDASQHVLAGDACSPSSNNYMIKLLNSFIESI